MSVCLPQVSVLKTEEDVFRVRASLPRVRAGDPLQSYKWALTMRLRAIRSRAAGEIDRTHVKALFTEARECQDCGEEMAGWNGVRPTLDHKVALANGGTNESHNLRVICNRCNSRKAHRAFKLRKAA